MSEFQFELSTGVTPVKAKSAVIVEFENGSLKSSGRSKLRFTCYKDVKSKTNRILVAKSNRLTYVGNNFDSALSKITSTELKICVLNRKSKTLKLFGADFFRLKPHLKCPEIINIKKETYTEKASDLTLTFGSKIQQKKITSRFKYTSNAEDCLETVATDLKSISDATGEQITSSANNENNLSTVIPPQNSAATNIGEIYNIFDIIPKEDFDMLDSEAQIFLDVKVNAVQQWKKENMYPDFIIKSVENNMMTMDMDRAKLLCYLNFMFCFLKANYKDWKKKDPVPGVPQPFKQRLLDCFTLNKSMPMRLKDKLLAYIIVLGLKLNNYVINCNLLASSTKMAVKRITSVAYALGCHVSGSKKDEAKVIQLKLPLYKFEEFSKKKFRK